MASGMSICHIILTTVTCLILLAAICVTTVSLVTPKWQEARVGDTGSDFPEIHYHGLWENCVKSTARVGSSDKDTVCELLIFDSDEPDTHVGHHTADKWRLVVLCLIAAGTFMGVLAFLFSMLTTYHHCCPVKGCAKCAGIFWLISHFFAVVLIVAGVGVFARKSYEVDNRYFLNISSRAVNEKGESFWFAVAGLGLFILSWLLCIGCVVLLFVSASKSSYRSPKVYDHGPPKTKIAHISNSQV